MHSYFPYNVIIFGSEPWMELKEYDDIQQKAGSSILMGVSLMDFWHVAEFCWTLEVV